MSLVNDARGLIPARLDGIRYKKRNVKHYGNAHMSKSS